MAMAKIEKRVKVLEGLLEPPDKVRVIWDEKEQSEEIEGDEIIRIKLRYTDIPKDTNFAKDLEERDELTSLVKNLFL
jgi:hypothetical protein